SEARDPPGSGSPGAGPGPRPAGSPLPKGRTRPPGAVARAGLSVSLRVPAPRVARVPRRAPRFRCPRVCSDPAVLAQVALCPRPQGFLSPRSPCAPLAAPMSPRCPPPISPVSPQHPPVSPRCPHGVPPCPQAGLARCQREAEEVAELMRQNVARALEREGHLEQLQSRAQDLRQASEAFTRTTQTVTRRQRRRHRRWRVVALGLGLLLLFILGLALALALARESPRTVSSTVPTPQGVPSTPPELQGTR
ncbi:VAMP5 protein, partial [Rhadina sibilatrix]|nr:VAMP5 protein [Rhadina sibilatrix]